MTEKISGIKFEELPENVQIAVNNILNHRIRIRLYSFLAIPTHFITMSMVFGNRKEILLRNLGLITGVNLAALHSHKREYAKEELQLFRALANSNDSKLKNLIASHKFAVVDRKGNLVGKNHAPKIWIIPIGRRRIPTKERPKQIKRKKTGFRRK